MLSNWTVCHCSIRRTRKFIRRLMNQSDCQSFLPFHCRPLLISAYPILYPSTSFRDKPISETDRNKILHNITTNLSAFTEKTFNNSYCKPTFHNVHEHFDKLLEHLIHIINTINQSAEEFKYVSLWVSLYRSMCRYFGRIQFKTNLNTI